MIRISILERFIAGGLLGLLALLGLLVASGCDRRPEGHAAETTSLSVHPSAHSPAAKIDVHGSDWPWWRGPNQDGLVGEQPIPVTWSETENVLWKTDVPGRGHSTPIVCKDRIFLTSADEQQQTVRLYCFEFSSGETLWETEIQSGPLATMHPKNSHASPTPACDGFLVFVPFIDPQQLYVAAVDLDGHVVWKRAVGPFHSEYGYGSSPVLHDSLVIVNGDSQGSAYVAALHRQTGEIVWRTPRAPSQENGSYATPIVTTLEGRPQLLLSGFDYVTSYDPLTGRQLWRVDGPTRVMANTLAVRDPFVIASGGWPEMEILCIRADKSSDAADRDIVWRSKKNVAYVPTPIVHDRSVLILSDNGTCADFDLETGTLNWQERLGGKYSASIVRVGDLYLVPNEAGETTVFRLTPKLEVVAKNNLADAGGMATPTVCDGKILLRTDHALYCVGEK